MTVTNVLINLLTAIKTNYIAKNKYAYCNFNKFCLEVLLVLYQDGLIAGYTIDSTRNKVKIELKYLHNKPLFSEINLISKPSLQLYVPFVELKKVLKRYNYFVVGTSSNILSSKVLLNNKQKLGPKIGGQLLFGIKLST